MNTLLNVNFKGRQQCFFCFLLFFIFVSCEDKKEDPTPAPVVTITSPADGAVQSGQFTVDVTVRPSAQVEKVEFFLNNIKIGEDTDSLYQLTVSTTDYEAGEYTLKASARTISGKTGSAERVIKIANPTLEVPLELRASKDTWRDKIVLQWRASPGATQYEIYKLDSETNAYLRIGKTDATTFEDHGVSKPLTSYFYKIRTYNDEMSFSDFTAPDYGYTAGQPYEQLRAFGEEGIKVNQFALPLLMSINHANGLLYICDNDGLVKKFNTIGDYWGIANSFAASSAPLFLENRTVMTAPENLVIQDEGEAPVFFPISATEPRGQIDTDPDGNIYVGTSQRVYAFDRNGQAITNWGTAGNGEGQITSLWGLAYYKGNLLVTCTASPRIQFFTPSGVFIRSIDLSPFVANLYGMYIQDDYIYVAAGDRIIKTDMEGTIIESLCQGELDYATSVVIDNDGNLVVEDGYARKIRIFRRN